MCWAHFKKQGNNLSAPAYESCTGESFAERCGPLAANGAGRKRAALQAQTNARALVSAP